MALLVVTSSDQDHDPAAQRFSSSPSTTTEAPPTTSTIPRVTQPHLLSQYCDAPGAKWPEVPPHVPGEPDRAQVRFLGGGVANASDAKDSEPEQMDVVSTLGGSTVLSPRTDGAFVDDLSVLSRTRTVACVTFLSTDPVGSPCRYGPSMFDGLPSPNQSTLQFSRNRYQITVYELHSGGILHRGEILTRGGGCPAWAFPEVGGGFVAWGLTDQDILSWLSSHFIDGKPA